MFILTRHAESTHNVENVFAGNKMDTHLTDEGRRESRILAEKIADNYKIEVIICSSLTRAVQTAEIFKKSLEEKYQKIVPIIKTKYLVEVDVGVITGMRPEEARSKFPTDFENIQSDKVNDWEFEDGENPTDLEIRYGNLLDLLEVYKDKNVLLVGHAMINQVIVKRVLGKEMGNFDHNTIVELKGLEEGL